MWKALVVLSILAAGDADAATAPVCLDSGKCDGSNEYLDCLNNLARTADQLLNMKYKYLKDQIRQTAKEQGLPPKQMLDELRTAERSWIDYQSKQCAFDATVPNMDKGAPDMIMAYDCECVTTYGQINEIERSIIQQVRSLKAPAKTTWSPRHELSNDE